MTVTRIFDIQRFAFGTFDCCGKFFHRIDLRAVGFGNYIIFSDTGLACRVNKAVFGFDIGIADDNNAFCEEFHAKHIAARNEFLFRYDLDRDGFDRNRAKQLGSNGICAFFRIGYIKNGRNLFALEIRFLRGKRHACRHGK